VARRKKSMNMAKSIFFQKAWLLHNRRTLDRQPVIVSSYIEKAPYTGILLMPKFQIIWKFQDQAKEYKGSKKRSRRKGSNPGIGVADNHLM
jgi:hypothetical protein